MFEAGKTVCPDIHVFLPVHIFFPERVDYDMNMDISGSIMPKKNEHFILKRHITEAGIQRLAKGHIPEAMEDKWFWYAEDGRLYIHRSWTGFCIFIMTLQAADDRHEVIVNRDPEQYTCKETKDDANVLNELLNWWTQENYDYYLEWISETAEAIEKAKKAPADRSTIGGKKVPAVFFHKIDEPNGYLSNWYPAAFELDGRRFGCSEQYIMYRKCKTFGDGEAADAVLATDDPAKQQSIATHAKGFDGTVWNGIRQPIACRALLAKFSQNAELYGKLLNTKDAYLVECAGHDRIWACGIPLDNADRFDTAKWKGKNILGFALMEIRQQLQETSAAGKAGKADSRWKEARENIADVIGHITSTGHITTQLTELFKQFDGLVNW